MRWRKVCKKDFKKDRRPVKIESEKRVIKKWVEKLDM